MKQASKDTAGRYLQGHGYVRYAFADTLRAVAYGADPLVRVPAGLRRTAGLPWWRAHTRLQTLVDAVGWDVAKVQAPDVRRLLERLGTEGVRENLGRNAWMDALMGKIVAGGHERVVVTDVRFENEALAIRERGGIIIQIESARQAPSTGHSSDQGLEPHLVDEVVTNPMDARFEALVYQAVNRAADRHLTDLPAA